MNELKFNPNDHLMNLKGKQYLQVMWRLVWFRQDHPDWSISTEMLVYDAEAKHAIFKATISDDAGRVIATSTGSESARDFGDFIEKAETKAMGRALAACGYGTQFTGDELDEGERIVDSPVQKGKPSTSEPPASVMARRERQAAAKADAPATSESDMYFRCVQCGNVLKPYTTDSGVEVGVRRHAEQCIRKFGKVVCIDCINKNIEEEKNKNA